MDRMHPSSSAEPPHDRGDDRHKPRDELIDRIVAATCAEVAAHLHLPEEPLRRSCDPVVRAAVDAVLDRRPPVDPPVEPFVDLARRYARDGVPVEAVVSAFRVAVRRAWELFVDRRDGGNGQTDVELVNALWTWADAATSRQFLAYRTVERGLARDDKRRCTFVRKLLYGGLSNPELDEASWLFGLSPTGRYRALRARTWSPLSPAELARSIETALEGPQAHPGMVVALDRDAGGIVSQSPGVARDVTIALGPPADLQTVEHSFRLASRALETAVACGVSGIVTMESLGVRPAVLAESYIGDALVTRYLERLDELGDFGATLLSTVRAYLKEEMSIDRCARILFIHPNTLRHRLDRFREVTGADLTRPEDIVKVWWAVERRQMLTPIVSH